MVLFGTILVLVVHTTLRAYGLYGDATARAFVIAAFLLLWATPWLLLTRTARQELGFARLPRPRALVAWVLAGAACAVVIHVLFAAVFGLGAQHAYSSIRDWMFSGVAVPDVDGWIVFAIFATPGLIFSPIGEEFFCRGVLAKLGSYAHGRWLEVVLPASVFSALHIMHHGLARDGAGWVFMPASGALWVAAMFLTSVVFSLARMHTRSIWTAVFCHASFNLVMTAVIFLALVRP